MLEFLKRGFEKTFGAISSVKKSKKIDKESLEEILLEADVAYEIVEEILYYLPPQDEVSRADLRRVMSSYFIYEKERVIEPDKPFVDLILGVNGAGKTTTIAKLANLYKNNGKSVILGACDTFRAGAIEQLRQWSIRLNVPIVATPQGQDPSAVAYDTISSALAKGIDCVILDTAGRLQNQTNLANELDKIVRISKKAYEKAPHRRSSYLMARRATLASRRQRHLTISSRLMASSSQSLTALQRAERYLAWQESLSYLYFI